MATSSVKVFVGNLSFKTREAELAQEFSAAGPVISANIITRGPRSLGYGFVELQNDADANKAVELLNKKEIDGRQINVEVARPRQERPEGGDSNAAQNTNQGGAPRRGSFRGRGGRGSGRGRGRGGRNQGQQGQNQGQQGQGEGQPQRQPRQRRRGGQNQSQQSGEGEQQQGVTGQRRRGGRGGRGSGAGRGGNRGNRRADDGPREESDTTLFVANLPFSVTDESLKSEFSAGGLNVKAAHVVTRVTGRSKGYGFVEYESKADQGRALAQFENKELEGRQLIVKIALKDNRPPADDAQGQQGQQTQQ